MLFGLYRRSVKVEFVFDFPCFDANLTLKPFAGIFLVPGPFSMLGKDFSTKKIIH